MSLENSAWGAKAAAERAQKRAAAVVPPQPTTSVKGAVSGARADKGSTDIADTGHVGSNASAPTDAQAREEGPGGILSEKNDAIDFGGDACAGGSSEAEAPRVTEPCSGNGGLPALQAESQPEPVEESSPLSKEDIAILESLGQEERRTFIALHKQVMEEANGGGPRMLFSILRTFEQMTREQLEWCIDLYARNELPEHLATRSGPVATAPDTMAPEAPGTSHGQLPLPQVQSPSPIPPGPDPGDGTGVVDAAAVAIDPRFASAPIIAPSAPGLPEFLSMPPLPPGFSHPPGRAGDEQTAQSVKLPDKAVPLVESKPLAGAWGAWGSHSRLPQPKSPAPKAPLAGTSQEEPAPQDAIVPALGVQRQKAPLAGTSQEEPAPRDAIVPALEASSRPPSAAPTEEDAPAESPEGQGDSSGLAEGGSHAGPAEDAELASGAATQVSSGGNDSRLAAPPAAGRTLPAVVGSVSLDTWIRRRVFELRVAIGPTELLAVLEAMKVDQLVQPFTEVKLWLGLEEKEPLPAALETLVSEYRALRQSAEGIASVTPSSVSAPADAGAVDAGRGSNAWASSWGKKSRT